MSTATKLAIASCVVMVTVPARAGGVLHDLASEIAAKLDAIRASHVTAAPVVPVPVAVKWKPIRIASEELGAPLVALAAGDLHGDGRDELYAVTTREVIAFRVAEHRLEELGRVTFVGEQAVPASRDPVGAAMIAGRVLFASSSAYTRGVKVSWHGKQLVGELGETGMELCAGERAVLVPGRDYFGDDKNGYYYRVRCRELADRAGTPQSTRALLGMTGKLDVTVDNPTLPSGSAASPTLPSGSAASPTLPSGSAASPTLPSGSAAGHYAFAKVGTAFELADLDRDGKPELVYASASAPGEPDEVRAVTLGEDEKKTKWKKAFTAGGVAGIAVGDFDGAPAVIAAVRLIGSTRVDVWRLN